MPDNLHRMIALAERVFDARNDPEQISVTDDDRDKLLRLHPATMTEARDEEGPVAWMLIFPTTMALLRRFLEKEISEQNLLDQTPLGARYDALYLCSALVLEDRRREGLARRLLTDAITAIMVDHPIAHFGVWAFSAEGEALAAALAEQFGVPLLRRPETST
jgi:hypothetical protein